MLSAWQHGAPNTLHMQSCGAWGLKGGRRFWSGITFVTFLGFEPRSPAWDTKYIPLTLNRGSDTCSQQKSIRASLALCFALCYGLKEIPLSVMMLELEYFSFLYTCNIFILLFITIKLGII